MLKKTASSAFTTGDTYYVEAYDISSSKVAGLLVLYGNDGTLTSVKKDTNFSIVSTLPESVYNEVKDDSVLQFNVFAGSNTEKAWTTYDRTEFADAQIGDVIQFAYDSDQLAQGRINNIKFADIAEVLDGKTYDGKSSTGKKNKTLQKIIIIKNTNSITDLKRTVLTKTKFTTAHQQVQFLTQELVCTTSAKSLLTKRRFM